MYHVSKGGGKKKERAGQDSVTFFGFGTSDLSEADDLIPFIFNLIREDVSSCPSSFAPSRLPLYIHLACDSREEYIIRRAPKIQAHLEAAS